FFTMWTPSAPCDGLWYPAKDLSEPVASGAVLGEIKDVFGAVRATIRAEKDGMVLYRLSSLAVNQGEALIGIGTPLAGGGGSGACPPHDTPSRASRLRVALLAMGGGTMQIGRMSRMSNISRRRRSAQADGSADYAAKRAELVRIAAKLF